MQTLTWPYTIQSLETDILKIGPANTKKYSRTTSDVDPERNQRLENGRKKTIRWKTNVNRIEHEKLLDSDGDTIPDIGYPGTSSNDSSSDESEDGLEGVLK